MQITRFTYEYGAFVRSISMIVTGRDGSDHLIGYEVWRSVDVNDTWIVDDEPTIIVHPILSERSEGRVRRVFT